MDFEIGLTIVDSNIALHARNLFLINQYRFVLRWSKQVSAQGTAEHPRIDCVNPESKYRNQMAGELYAVPEMELKNTSKQTQEMYGRYKYVLAVTRFHNVKHITFRIKIHFYEVVGFNTFNPTAFEFIFYPT